MGIDHSELKSILRKNVQLFLAEVSPVVSVCLFIEVHEISKFWPQILDKLSPGIITGEGLQEEVCKPHPQSHTHLL